METSFRHHPRPTRPLAVLPAAGPVRGAAPPDAAPCGIAPADPLPGCLTPRERAVVLALCEGLDRRAVARRIRRSPSTCDKTICAIYRATGFGAAHQVVAWAFRVGLVRAAPGIADGRRR